MTNHARSVVSELLGRAGIGLNGEQPFDLRLHDARLPDRVLAEGTLGLGEAYMDGWWDCDALDDFFCRALRARLDEQVRLTPRLVASTLVARFLNRQTRRRSRRVAEVHYDLGNEFFAAMLDPAMQYSCAYFRGTDDLAEAQRHKLDLIARKLLLQPGQRVLDIGCGWGGLARHLATNQGCRVTGLTVSSAQKEYADDLTRGLPVEIRLEDYRSAAGTYDRVVSVGMLEHVGHRNYRTFMETVARLLPEGGLLLLHTITGHASRVRSDPWIERHIFPNSMLPSPAQVTRAAEGLLVLEDVHAFGADYDRTLLAWERNFTRAWEHFRPKYGERFGRMWRYYLLSCAGAFRARSINLCQFVFSKGGVPGGYVAAR